MNLKKCLLTIFVIVLYFNYMNSQTHDNKVKTLYYLNKQLKLNVSEQDLIEACYEFERDDLEKAQELLHLNSTDADSEVKNNIVKATCKGLEEGFADPTDPTIECNIPICPDRRKKCLASEMVFVPQPNKNCQKPSLDGGCLEYVPCAKLT